MNRHGQIQKFDVPETWPNESASLTPWLEEHIGEFGEVLDPKLDVASREAPLGDFSLESQQPGIFSPHIQNRVRSDELLLLARHLRFELADLETERVGLGPLRTSLLRRLAPPRASASGLASHRQTRAVHPFAAKQPSDLTGPCAAVRPLEEPQPILGGEPAPGGLGQNLRVQGSSRFRAFAPEGLVATLLALKAGAYASIPLRQISLLLSLFSSTAPTNFKGSRCINEVAREGCSGTLALRRSSAFA